MVTWLPILAVVAVALLAWNLYRRFGSDRIAELNEQRRTSSRVVSRGELVDGNRHLNVALALTQSTFFYENADLQGSLDLQWVGEVEYDSELTTGRAVSDGKVLRLRCYSQTFEFVLPQEAVARWQTMLPATRGAVPSGIAPPVAAAS